ncbi:MAG: hypothetical protein WBP45_02410, partial [Daejeonella sp.]
RWKEKSAKNNLDYNYKGYALLYMDPWAMRPNDCAILKPKLKSEIFNNNYSMIDKHDNDLIMFRMKDSLSDSVMKRAISIPYFPNRYDSLIYNVYLSKYFVYRVYIEMSGYQLGELDQSILLDTSENIKTSFYYLDYNEIGEIRKLFLINSMEDSVFPSRTSVFSTVRLARCL